MNIPLYNPGEPFLVVQTKRPTSIWQAICNLTPKQRETIGIRLFELRKRDAHLLMAEAILARVTETMLQDENKVFLDKNRTLYLEVFPGPPPQGSPVTSGPPTFHSLLAMMN